LKILHTNYINRRRGESRGNFRGSQEEKRHQLTKGGGNISPASRAIGEPGLAEIYGGGKKNPKGKKSHENLEARPRLEGSEQEGKREQGITKTKRNYPEDYQWLPSL